MNNPEKVVHAKNTRKRVFTDLYLPFTSNYWKREWSTKKKRHYFYRERVKKRKKYHLPDERESSIFGMPARRSLFIFWVPFSEG